MVGDRAGARLPCPRSRNGLRRAVRASRRLLCPRPGACPPCRTGVRGAGDRGRGSADSRAGDRGPHRRACDRRGARQLAALHAAVRLADPEGVVPGRRRARRLGCSPRRGRACAVGVHGRARRPYAREASGRRVPDLQRSERVHGRAGAAAAREGDGAVRGGARAVQERRGVGRGLAAGVSSRTGREARRRRQGLAARLDRAGRPRVLRATRARAANSRSRPSWTSRRCSSCRLATRAWAGS